MGFLAPLKRKKRATFVTTAQGLRNRTVSLKLISQMFIVGHMLECFVIAGCGAESPQGSTPRSSTQQPFEIAVVGSGVSDDAFAWEPRASPFNSSQGRAMWAGAKHAYDHSLMVAKVKPLFVLKGYDDLGSVEKAARIANQLRSNQNILAVIGHATSATTRAAAAVYADAGIPLLMPIATSPFAPFRPEEENHPEKRLSNCFRLPPSDLVQAPAVALVATTPPISSKRCILLRDTSIEASEYSGPLYGELAGLLSDSIVDRLSFDPAKDALRDLGDKIIIHKPDLVILCGYGRTAQLFLQVLRNTFADTASRPKVILTDGCRYSELETGGFDVYLTFPLQPVTMFKSTDQNECGIVQDKLTEPNEESYQLYGYDAVVLLAQAISDRLAAGVSRPAIIEALGSSKSFTGACFAYTFYHGENKHSSYAVYLASHDKAKGVFLFDRLLNDNEISDFAASRRKP